MNEKKHQPVILHVINLFGAGVVTALGTYINSSEHCSHHILTNKTAFYNEEEPVIQQSASIDYNLGKNTVTAIRNIKRLYKKLNPDKVHLHSSFAGFYGRLSGIPSEKIIYTPHGFSFQRTDISNSSRKILYYIEKSLSLMCKRSVIVACGGTEHQAALKLQENSLYLPNYAEIPDDIIWEKPAKNKVCMIGRICNQKDPEFFIQTKNLTTMIDPSIEFVWIGDGDELLKSNLLNDKITVTGWLPKIELLNILANCSTYLHTAAWDGLPMSLLEASKIMTPLVIRSNEAMEFLGAYSTNTPQEAADKIINIINSNVTDSTLNEIINKNSNKHDFIKIITKIYS